MKFLELFPFSQIPVPDLVEVDTTAIAGKRKEEKTPFLPPRHLPIPQSVFPAPSPISVSQCLCGYLFLM